MFDFCNNFQSCLTISILQVLYGDNTNFSYLSSNYLCALIQLKEYFSPHKFLKITKNTSIHTEHAKKKSPVKVTKTHHWNPTTLPEAPQTRGIFRNLTTSDSRFLLHYGPSTWQKKTHTHTYNVSTSTHKLSSTKTTQQNPTQHNTTQPKGCRMQNYLLAHTQHYVFKTY